MKVARGESERVSLEMTEAVPVQYVETDQEIEIGVKTVKNVKMLKKSLLVGSIMKN